MILQDPGLTSHVSLQYSGAACRGKHFLYFSIYCVPRGLQILDSIGFKYVTDLCFVVNFEEGDTVDG